MNATLPPALCAWKNVFLSVSFVIAGSIACPAVAQHATVQPARPANKKIYLEKKFERLPYDPIDKFRTDPVNLWLRITGPEAIQPGRMDEFTVEIIPDNDPLKPEQPGYTVEDLDAYFVSSHGFIRFHGTPAYSAVTANETGRMHDMPRLERQSRVVLEALATTLAYCIGPQAVVLQVASSLGKTADLLKAREPDWTAEWRQVFENDYYLVPYPRASKPSRNYKRLSIDCPVAIEGTSGMLQFHLRYLELLWTDHSGLTGKRYYIEDQLFGLIVGSPEAPVPAAVNTPLAADARFSIPNGGMLHLNAVIEPSQTSGQTLRMEIRPDPSHYDYFSMKRIGFGIAAPAGTLLPTGMPAVVSQHSAGFRQVSLRGQMAPEIAASWLLSAISIGGLSLQNSPAKAALQIAEKSYTIGHSTAEVLSNELLSNSFSQIMEQAWAMQAGTDLYSFPEFSNDRPGSKALDSIGLTMPLQLYGQLPQRMALMMYCQFEYVKKGEVQTRQEAVSIALPLSFKPVPARTAQLAFGFIIDSSGSMRETDPHDIRTAAMRIIVDWLKGDEQIFIVDFDQQAKWLNPDDYQQFDKVALKTAVNRIDSDGGTDVRLGLNRMREVMEKHSRSARAGVLLLSDGMSPYGDEAAWFAGKSVPVYTVSYKSLGNTALLSRIALETGGLLVQADHERDIVAAFIQFYNMLAGQNRYTLASGSMTADELNLTRRFFVDPGSTELYGNLSWDTGSLSMEVEDPDGKCYSPASGAGAWVADRNYSNVRIARPRAGEWNVRLSGEHNPDGSWSFEAGGKSPLELRMEELDRSTGLIGYQLTGDASAVNLEAARASIQVHTPAGRAVDISTLFNGGGFRYLPRDGPGAYRFDLQVDAETRTGEPLQRSFSRTVYLAESDLMHRAAVSQVTGTFLRSPLGSDMGNYQGMKCTIYDASGSLQTPKAVGYVTQVSPGECTIRILQTMTASPVTAGDVVELDLMPPAPPVTK